MPKPPYFSQVYPFSCVPACLRMVLASLGLEKTEAEIRSFCECDETGTSLPKAVEAVEKFGFDAYRANLGFEELEDLISQNVTPIIYLRITEGISYSHAVVVYKISKGKVYVLDPELGERNFSINQLNETWSRGLTIVIEKKS